jgi:hypothetical protein
MLITFYSVSDYMAGDTADASIGMLSTSLQGIGGIRNKNISQSLSPYRGLQSSKVTFFNINLYYNDCFIVTR